MEKISSHDTDLDEIILEQIKQVSLDLFHSIFVKRSIEDVMEHIDEDIQWMGSESYFIAHSKEKLRALMEREIEEMPDKNIVKVIWLNAVQIEQNAFSVTGELEIRMDFGNELNYVTQRFMLGVGNRDDKIRIKSAQTFMSSDNPALHMGATGIIQERQINRDARNNENCDHLTGLYNLDYFKSTLRLYLDRVRVSSGYALLYTDITNFEKLNNLYGLQSADQLLIKLSELITTFNKKVVFCCRSVADHFLILYEYDDKVIQKEVSNLCHKFNEKLSGNYNEAVLELGVGIYIIQNYKISVDKMVEYANVARKSLRLSNNSSIAFYDSNFYKQAQEVKDIETRMEKALSDGEFKVFIQPKYDLLTEKIVGAEALVRWIRQDGMMVYPDEFIPIFEKNGFIQEIDFYVLEQTCRMIRHRLKEKKRCVPISVNQSRYLLQNINYSAKIAKILSRYNTPPELIELELTERLFSDKLNEMAKVMEDLKNLGIRWSIDDFGTGYSSLNLLKELPVDIIKIDKAFLDETETSEVSRVIIRKTVELTRELNKLVVCEGVETSAQADYLRTICCDVAQGFLYAKPMPMSEFEVLLDAGN